ncbi:MAG: hypothetical protein LM576_08440, partial [Thermofilum sp.]|nr:hypothetical protein [Thermofilum sp.]
RRYFIQKLPIESFIFNRDYGRSSRFKSGFAYLLVEKARSLSCVSGQCEAVLQTSHGKRKTL